MSTFVSGNAGRIYRNGTSTPVAGINKWNLKKATKPITLLHFESPVDADGNVWEQQLPGSSVGDGKLDGWYDVNPTTAPDGTLVGFRNGLQVIVSLILNRSLPFGFNQILVQITDYEGGSDITADKPALFSFSFKTSGIVGSTTTVTG
jgi:hypothetical protein